MFELDRLGGQLQGCLCRRHHRIKQRPRWRVEMEPGAVLVWTDPCGRVHTTLPPDQLQLDDAAVAVASALPSVLEDEIVLCLGRHHRVARARLRQGRHAPRQPARRGTSSHDPPPF